MIFARKNDAALASLVKEIDKVVAANKDKKMASFVNFLGTDADELKAAAKKFAEENKIENVALVVPLDHEKGPQEVKLHDDASVTVMLYSGLKVKANHALKDGGLSKAAIGKIVDDTSKILK
jgi:hypothetical protein